MKWKVLLGFSLNFLIFSSQGKSPEVTSIEKNKWIINKMKTTKAKLTYHQHFCHVIIVSFYLVSYFLSVLFTIMNMIYHSYLMATLFGH